MKAFVLSLLIVALVPGARAELSAPDNILYGTIALNGTPVPATNTAVVIEARRTANGPAIATYRMGDNASAANFYALKLPIEEQAPLDTPATSSLVSNTLFIVVKNTTTDRGSQSYTIPERGRITRLDFDIDPPTAPPDTDSDGMPDPWEQGQFGGLTQSPTGDFDGDGQSNVSEYLAGTDPKSGVGSFQLIVTRPAGVKTVSFFGVSTVGVAGYEGSTRHYGIETTPNLVIGPWTPVIGYTDIIGSNATVNYPTPEPNPAAYYRGKVWLTRP